MVLQKNVEVRNLMQSKNGSNLLTALRANLVNTLQPTVHRLSNLSICLLSYKAI